MRKKIVALSMAVLMLAVCVIGGTLAYFTDTDEATNTFSVGGVEIEQIEQERNANGGLQAFTQDQVVMPAILDKLTPKTPITVNGYDLTIRNQAGNYVDKIVSVYNKGKSEAYVRTIIAIPTGGDSYWGNPTDNWLHYNCVSDNDTNPANGWYWGTKETGEYPSDPADMNVIQNVKINGVEYDLNIVTNVNKIAAEEYTAPCLMGFYLDDDVNADDQGYYMMRNGERIGLEIGDKMNILVFSQAVQTEGFADAWEAFEKSGLPSNPWA